MSREMVSREMMLKELNRSLKSLSLTDPIVVENGNYFFAIDRDSGTKVRVYDDEVELNPKHPESLDLKITNYCAGGCAWCHENSTVHGEHADFEYLKKFVSSFPPGVEVAIGGGDPIEYPHLPELLQLFLNKNALPSITVNAKTLLKNFHKLENLRANNTRGWLFYGVGISIANAKEFLKLIEVGVPQDFLNYKHAVYHMIAGIVGLKELEEFSKTFQEKFDRKPKILILGYKTFGRGVAFLDLKKSSVHRKIEEIKENFYYIHQLFEVLSVDNLAVEQFELLNRLPKAVIDEHYLGDDGLVTMYLDAVKQEASLGSYRDERIPAKIPNLEIIFAEVRKLYEAQKQT